MTSIKILSSNRKHVNVFQSYPEKNICQVLPRLTMTFWQDLAHNLAKFMLSLGMKMEQILQDPVRPFEMHPFPCKMDPCKTMQYFY